MDGIGLGVSALLLGAGVAVGVVVRRQAVLAAVAVARAEERAVAAVAEARAEAAERRHDETARELEAARRRADDLVREARRLAEERTRLGAELVAERDAAAERAGEVERAREAVRAEVEKLAGRVLDEKGKALLERSREGLAALLGPVGDRLKAFEERIERTYHEEGRDRASLLRELKLLQEAQQTLSRQADGLSRALTGESKAQGDWGELVLERVLETAGLAAGREYELQVTHVDDDGGRKRPDALVYLPGDRAIVVDAKCSLTAFVEAMRAEEPAVREEALERHVGSVRTHVRGLAAKSYADVLERRTLDLVLLFVPNEAALHAAIARAPGLYEEAFRQRIVLCSPTTLLAALRVVAHVWSTEKQNLNAQRIADEAGKLLDKLSDFVGDLDQLGARLEQAQESFTLARGKLRTGRGNAMRRAAELAELGARGKPEKVERLLRAAAEDGEDEATAPGAAAPAGASRP